ncbi:WD repeat-containing protein 43-like isoform X1 [Dermatophagoides pteronyssinus]|uniref:WD repeat-containing protein 43-like isoform X1 n=2 Tax=Dermatophagoides pteronyssinus TaxID=6956 RepID=UPI003F67B89A
MCAWCVCVMSSHTILMIPHMLPVETKMTNNNGQINVIGDECLMNMRPMSISSCGRYFALATLAGQLNVWDTITANLVAQYIPSKHLSANCTKICWPPDHHHSTINNQINGTPKKQNDIMNELKKLTLLAMGTENGTIFLFSVHKNEIHSILMNDSKKSMDGHTERINDLCWSSSMDSLFSCSQDKFIIEWSIIESKIKCKTILDHNSVITSICVLDNENLITGSNQLKWWNWPKKQLLKTFNGHSNEVRFLRPIWLSSKDSSTKDAYLLSSAISDRYINLWKLDQSQSPSKTNKASNSLASFLLDDEPISLEIAHTVIDNSFYILSVSKSGHFYMFEETIESASNTKGPVSPKYRLNIQTSCDDKKNFIPSNKRSKIERQIPYMYAYLDSKQLIGKSLVNGNTNNHQQQLKDKNRIYIQTIYGAPNRPIFERLSISECEKLCQEQKSSSLTLITNNNNNTTTIIKDPSILKSIELLPRPSLENVSISKENNTKIKSAKHSDRTTVIGPAGMVPHQPLFNGVNGDGDTENNDEIMLSEDEQDLKCSSIDKQNVNDDKKDKINNIKSNNLKKSNNNKSELTLDEQLKLMETNNEITLDKQDSSKRKKRDSDIQNNQQQIGTESLVSVLVQGLQSNDTKMLSTVLQTDHTDMIIMNTVKKLPIQHVPKLLNQLQKGLISGQQKKEDNVSNSGDDDGGGGGQYSIYLKWITFLLRNRFSYLMTMPNSAEKFLPLKQLIQAKTASLEKFYQLKGRLDLILSQTKLDDTQDTTKLSFTKPKLTYESESSDDESSDLDDDDDDDDQMLINDMEETDEIEFEKKIDELSDDDDDDEDDESNDEDELTDEIEDSDADDDDVERKSLSKRKRKRSDYEMDKNDQDDDED